MGFQVPPTLPDYSKLTFLLNNTGVQKWNPAVYDILKNLIEAVQQSQNVITDDITNIENIVNNLGTPLTVDPAGALNSPVLKVRVDGTSIIINGSNNLEGLIHVASVSLTQGELNGLSTTPKLAITGISNKVIFPIAVQWSATQVSAFNLARSAQLIYNVGGAAALIASWPSSLNSIGAFTSNAGIAGTAALKTPDAALSASVYIKGNADNTGGTSSNTAICTIYYTII
jgi:hypothetical protein